MSSLLYILSNLKCAGQTQMSTQETLLKNTRSSIVETRKSFICTIGVTGTALTSSVILYRFTCNSKNDIIQTVANVTKENDKILQEEIGDMQKEESKRVEDIKQNMQEKSKDVSEEILDRENANKKRLDQEAAQAASKETLAKEALEKAKTDMQKAQDDKEKLAENAKLVQGEAEKAKLVQEEAEKEKLVQEEVKKAKEAQELLAKARLATEKVRLDQEKIEKKIAARKKAKEEEEQKVKERAEQAEQARKDQEEFNIQHKKDASQFIELDASMRPKNLPNKPSRKIQNSTIKFEERDCEQIERDCEQIERDGKQIIIDLHINYSGLILTPIALVSKDKLNGFIKQFGGEFYTICDSISKTKNTIMYEFGKSCFALYSMSKNEHLGEIFKSLTSVLEPYAKQINEKYKKRKKYKNIQDLDTKTIFALLYTILLDDAIDETYSLSSQESTYKPSEAKTKIMDTITNCTKLHLEQTINQKSSTQQINQTYKNEILRLSAENPHKSHSEILEILKQGVIKQLNKLREDMIKYNISTTELLTPEVQEDVLTETDQFKALVYMATQAKLHFQYCTQDLTHSHNEKPLLPYQENITNDNIVDVIIRKIKSNMKSVYEDKKFIEKIQKDKLLLQKIFKNHTKQDDMIQAYLKYTVFRGIFDETILKNDEIKEYFLTLDLYFAPICQTSMLPANKNISDLKPEDISNRHNGGVFDLIFKDEKISAELDTLINSNNNSCPQIQQVN